MVDEKSEILEPVHAVVRELIERDRRGVSHHNEFTDSDIVGVTLLYAHVTTNRLIHTMTEEKVSIGFSKSTALGYGELIKTITQNMTNVDMDNHYTKEEE